MNYKEISHAMTFGAKSMNTAPEIATEFCNLHIDSRYTHGKFWIVGKSIMTLSSDLRYIRLFKSLSSQRAIVKLETPKNFPYISDSDLMSFCAKIIENYNMNYSKF